jgi:DNA-binding LytR/AlgR family response regulator
MSKCPRAEFQGSSEISKPRLRAILDQQHETADAEDTVTTGRHEHAIGRNDELAMPLARIAQSRRLLPHRDIFSRKASRIAVRSKGRILLLDLVEFLSVHAQGSYVQLQRETCSHLLRGSTSIMAEKLEPYGFIRIHRSVLISTHVEEIQLLTGEYSVRIRPGRSFRVSTSLREQPSALGGFVARGRPVMKPGLGKVSVKANPWLTIELTQV